MNNFYFFFFFLKKKKKIKKKVIFKIKYMNKFRKKVHRQQNLTYILLIPELGFVLTI